MQKGFPQPNAEDLKPAQSPPGAAQYPGSQWQNQYELWMITGVTSPFEHLPAHHVILQTVWIRILSNQTTTGI